MFVTTLCAKLLSCPAAGYTTRYPARFDDIADGMLVSRPSCFRAPQYHPVTGQPVFLRMVIEDEDGRALKFRTRTRAEYARVRPGMVAEAILVRPKTGPIDKSLMALVVLGGSRVCSERESRMA